MKFVINLLIACLVLCALHVSSGSAQQFRNIISATHIDYENIGTSMVYENSLLTQVRPGKSILLRLYHDNRSTWNNSILTLGSVINIGRYHYYELTYGHGRDSDGRNADYYSLELTREKPKYLFGIAYKFSHYPGYSYNMLAPSLRYSLTSRLSLWGKYFLSKDSDDAVNHAHWIDAEFKITAKMSIRSGITGGNRLYSPEYEYILGGRADMKFSSFLVQLSYAITEYNSIKYQFERVSRQSKYSDIKNHIILDTRF